MPEYLSPSVYVENTNNSGVTTEVSSASTGGFIGILKRGEVNKPILVTSWTSFLNQFAYGINTPFDVNSDLVYSLYGFFQNGGTRAYLVRVVGTGAIKASAVIQDATPTTVCTFYAKDEGAWGNSLKVTISANADVPTNFDVKLYNGTELVESFINVSNTSTDENYFIDVITNTSKMISVASGTLFAKDNVAFTGGDDDLDTITDATYTGALEYFNVVEDVRLLAIPGQTSATVTNALATYVDGRTGVFAIFDAPKTNTVADVKTFRKSITCDNGGLYYPWIRVADPLSKNNKLRDCPIAGHMMGIIARTINKRGVWKAPAGTEATVKGAVSLLTTVTREDQDTLNPLSINVVMSRPNYGIVVWGARSLSNNSDRKYVSDILLDNAIKIDSYNNTQWSVFEPNDKLLWTRIITTLEDYLEGIRAKGGLKGDTPEQAYYVQCDEELNTKEVIDQGIVIAEIGYAGKKPGEFIVLRVNHSMNNN